MRDSPVGYGSTGSEKCCVIHLDMSSVAGANLYSIIDDFVKKLGLGVTFDSPLSDRFRKLINLANIKTGKPGVVIIDEYDKPILHKFNKPELREQIRE